MEKKVKVGEKEYTIKEIMYIDALSMEGLDKKTVAKNMLKKSAGLSDDEVSALTLKEGVELQKHINELNNIQTANFQEPTELKQS